MKKVIFTLLACISGWLIGFLIADFVFAWLAAAVQAPLVMTRFTSPFNARIQFAGGCGALLGSAIFFGRSRLGSCTLLGVGMIVGSCVAVSWHTMAIASVPDMKALGMNPIVSVAALPVLKIPLSGVVAILVVAAVRYFLDRDAEAKSDPVVLNRQCKQ